MARVILSNVYRTLWFRLSTFLLFALFVLAIAFRSAWLPIDAPSLLTHALLPGPTNTNTPDDKPLKAQEHDDVCQHLPGAEKVFVLLKTGASEIYQKLPIHLQTTLSCIPHFRLFSDLEQDISGFEVHDALASVSAETRSRATDFSLYDLTQQWAHAGQDLSKLPSGWELDKYKFMPMLHSVFDDAPESIEWFLMIEPDTSLSWLNLLLWLQTMDSQLALYMGSENTLGGTTFAHGGSGIVISRGAADKLTAARNNEAGGTEHYDKRWEDSTSNICCGDVIVARALLEVGVEVTPTFPLTQGESINTIDWTQRHWCTPAVTWHHISGQQIDSLWHFQTLWADEFGWSTPFLYRDLFAHYIEENISVNRTMWNNLSKDEKYDREDIGFADLEQYKRDAVESADACAAACSRAPESECLQWMWTTGKCYLGRDIRYGTTDALFTEHWDSGWMSDRIERYKSSFEGCEVKWRGS